MVHNQSPGAKNVMKEVGFLLIAPMLLCKIGAQIIRITHYKAVFVALEKTQNKQLSCNIGKSAKNSSGIFRFSNVRACLHVFTQQINLTVKC